MSDKNDPQNVIDSFQRRQQMMPFLIGGLAVVLVVVGIIVLVLWFSGGNGPSISLFASATPTATSTFTPTPVTPTATATQTATETTVPTETLTPTPSGPFEYTVQENDNCFDIAATYEVDLMVLLAINNFGSSCPIKPGDKILVPAPDTQLPTETPLPADIARGTKITYIVKLGDTMDIIASKFNTTVDDILLQNKIEDANTLFAGQELIIRVNLVTPTPTIAPTSTAAATTVSTATSVPTATPRP